MMKSRSRILAAISLSVAIAQLLRRRNATRCRPQLSNPLPPRPTTIFTPAELEDVAAFVEQEDTALAEAQSRFSGLARFAELASELRELPQDAIIRIRWANGSGRVVVKPQALIAARQIVSKAPHLFMIKENSALPGEIEQGRMVEGVGTKIAGRLVETDVGYEVETDDVIVRSPGVKKLSAASRAALIAEAKVLFGSRATGLRLVDTPDGARPAGF